VGLGISVWLSVIGWLATGIVAWLTATAAPACLYRNLHNQWRGEGTLPDTNERHDDRNMTILSFATVRRPMRKDAILLNKKALSFFYL
jgi:hypothetical protein